MFFDILDTNNDNLLTGRDGLTDTESLEGIIGVSQSASALVIHLGEDSVRFENVAFISSADWV